MKKFNFTIKDENGIHARPAGLLVKEANKFSSQIEISSNGKTADAKKIFALMSLGVKNNTEILVEINGIDEDKAYESLKVFFKNNL